MNKFKKISILAVLAMLFVFALFSNSSCNIYKFNEATIPDSIKKYFGFVRPATKSKLCEEEASNLSFPNLTLYGSE